MTVNVFISYPEEYESGANALARALQRSGINFYSFLHTPPLPGSDFPSNIRWHIENADFLVLLWGIDSSTTWINYEVQYAQHFGKAIIPVLGDNSNLPYGLEYNQAILAFRDPNGWVLQVSDAIVNIVNYVNYQQQIEYQNQQRIQEDRERKEENDRNNFLTGITTGIVGIGALLAIASALEDN